MKIGKKKRAAAEALLATAAEQQGAFWDTLRDLETLLDTEIDSTDDLSGCSIDDFLAGEIA